MTHGSVLSRASEGRQWVVSRFRKATLRTGANVDLSRATGHPPPAFDCAGDSRIGWKLVLRHRRPPRLAGEGKWLTFRFSHRSLTKNQQTFPNWLLPASVSSTRGWLLVGSQAMIRSSDSIRS